MIHWKTSKRWTYKGRSCEIQETSVAGAVQFRGLVEAGTDVSERALEDAPFAGLKSKTRPNRSEEGEFREWVYFSWTSGEITNPRKEVNRLAECIARGEV